MPPKIAPVDWKTLVKVFKADGFHHNRTKGDHIVMTKPGVLWPVVIPKYSEILPDIILSNMRTAKLLGRGDASPARVITARR